MWTETTRKKYERKTERYASDVTDEEWALIADELPERRPLGRPRTTDLREVVNAIFYLLRTGCQWRLRPEAYPSPGASGRGQQRLEPGGRHYR